MATSKKDYNAIAQIIAETIAVQHMGQQWCSGCDSARERIARHLADYFAADNPLFDRARFHRACLTTGGY